MKKGMLLLAGCLAALPFSMPSFAAEKAAANNTASAACRRDAMRLLSLSKSPRKWSLVSVQEDATYAHYKVERGEERGDIGWMRNTGPDAVQNCTVVITKNGKATYSFEDEAPASSRNPVFFADKLGRGGKGRN